MSLVCIAEATADPGSFCEEDYAVTRYIAEFVNTLTNLAYVYFAFRSPHRPGGPRGAFPLGMDAPAASLVLLGVFSFVFHATLHRETQFLDEMSMFLLGASLLQPLYTTGLATARGRAAVTTGLVAVVGAVSAAYHQTRVVELHWGAFFVMENLIWPRALWLVYRRPRPAAGSGGRGLKGLFWSATLVMALALGLWTVDLTWCPPLRALRARVGGLWSVLLELHGWWHVLTAVAAARYIELVREICA